MLIWGASRLGRVVRMKLQQRVVLVTMSASPQPASVTINHIHGQSTTSLVNHTSSSIVSPPLQSPMTACLESNSHLAQLLTSNYRESDILRKDLTSTRTTTLCILFCSPFFLSFSESAQCQQRLSCHPFNFRSRPTRHRRMRSTCQSHRTCSRRGRCSQTRPNRSVGGTPHCDAGVGL